MNAQLVWLDPVNVSVTVLLFLIGLLCLLTQRNAIKQVIGLKIMLQGVTLSLIHAGHQSGDVHFAETMVISALVVETIVIAIALLTDLRACYHAVGRDFPEALQVMLELLVPPLLALRHGDGFALNLRKKSRKIMKCCAINNL